jgi:hypothetical protein
MPLISCAWMRLSTEAAAIKKAALMCTYDEINGPNLCLSLWAKGLCPCKDEIL